MIGENLLDVVEKRDDNRLNEAFDQISESRVGRCLRTADYLYSVYAPGVKCPKVVVNDLRCAEELIGLLIQYGHRSIAGIFVSDNYQNIEKFQGMAATLQKNGVEYQDDYIKWCVSNEAHDVRFAHSIDHFLKRLPHCTAVVCCNCMIYQLVRQVLEKQGKRVPENCSLVCFDYSSEDWEMEGVTCSIHRGYRIGQGGGLPFDADDPEPGLRRYQLYLCPAPEIYMG